MKRLIGLAICACLSFACSSESSGPSGAKPHSIVVTPDSVTLDQQGDSIQLVPNVLDDNGHLISGISVVFTSNNPTIATVSPIGYVKPVGPAGVTSIKLKAGGITRNVPVVVISVANTITLTPNAPVIAQLSSVQLTAHVVDRNGDIIAGAPITYVSADPALAVVSPTGNVTSVGPSGSVLIGAQSGALNASVSVVIAQVPTTLSLVPDPLPIAVGGTGRLNARVLDAVGAPIAGATFTFTSNNTGLVTVDNTGLVTSVAQTGSTTIHVTSGTLSADATVNVVVASHPFGNIAANVPVASTAYGAAISPSGVVYVATLNGTVERGSLSSFSFSNVLNGLGQLAAVAFNPAGDEAYVAYAASGLQFIHVANNSITNSAGPIAPTPFDLAVSANGQRVYVGTDGMVYAIDVVSHSVVDSLQIGTVIHLALHPNQSKLYVSAINEAKVYELDTATLDTLRSFSLSGTIQGIGVSPDGNTLYAADESGGVYVINLTTGGSTRISANVCQAYGLLVTKDGQQVYISCYLDGEVKIIDTGTSAVIKTLSSLGGVRRLAMSPDGLSIVVVTEGGAAILIQ
ncbi:MAG: Ig-like domain-containing protein [Gemmatimonadota bacterium]